LRPTVTTSGVAAQCTGLRNSIARRPTGKVIGLSCVNFLSDQVVRRSLSEARTELALRAKVCTLRLLGPAISKAPRCREAVTATAGIARARSCGLTATMIALCRYTGCGLQSRDILLHSRLVVCEVGFLACDTGSGDKAIGARRTARHCLAISLRSRGLRRDEQSQKQD